MSSDKPRWQTIIENHTRNAVGNTEREERLARYAAREMARADHLSKTLGEVVATIDGNLGKDAEMDEFLGNIKTYILHNINTANQVAFRAQREDSDPASSTH
ncbi:hypothetical protein BI364_08885 [Acidihalobacter yilgarnensis]|uniref:Uncharacterized protein n=1 Tax=Acidihalobacter yilgarnensis TaxID=2819280 RepID=A0A1D8INS4_9GAMM|nr:hypothetical protein [Acidihalobacter yilgarnensis]AOU98061.1 hypothetical protein BI364_08885 [Acidihalobacter yilgarnensis]